MNAPLEKAPVDDKLQTAIECLAAESRTRQIATDARIDKLSCELQCLRQDFGARITQAEKHVEHELRSVRDEFNARLTQMETSVQHSLQLTKAELNSRFNQLEANFQRDLQVLRVEFNEKMSTMENSIHRTLLDTVKWMIGSMVALTAISITVNSTLYLRLARPGGESSPPSGLSARAAEKSSASLATTAQSPTLAATRPASAPSGTMP